MALYLIIFSRLVPSCFAQPGGNDTLLRNSACSIRVASIGFANNRENLLMLRLNHIP